MPISSTANFHIRLNEATAEGPEKGASDGSGTRIWGDWVYPRATASFHRQHLGRQAVALGRSVSLRERGVMPPPSPGQHMNLSERQEEAGFCSKQGNSTLLVELELRLRWSAGTGAHHQCTGWGNILTLL